MAKQDEVGEFVKRLLREHNSSYTRRAYFSKMGWRIVTRRVVPCHAVALVCVVTSRGMD